MDWKDFLQNDRGPREKTRLEDFLERWRQGREKKDKMISLEKIKTRKERKFKKGKGLKTITETRYKLVFILKTSY